MLKGKKVKRKQPTNSTYIVKKTVTTTRLEVERYPDTVSLYTAKNDVGLRLNVGSDVRGGDLKLEAGAEIPSPPPNLTPGHLFSRLPFLPFTSFLTIDTCPFLCHYRWPCVRRCNDKPLL